VATKDDALELAIALKRKLINVNQEKRTYKKLKILDSVKLEEFKTNSKALDKAYSACLSLTIWSGSQTAFDAAYKALLDIYQQT
jgi:hypothetical protein